MLNVLKPALPLVAGVGLFVGLFACTSESTDKIPADAPLVAQGDELISYRAPHDGTVYIWDSTRDQIVYSGPVHREQLVSVDQKHNHIDVDSQRVSENSLTRGNRYNIYFKQGPTPRDRNSDIDRHRRFD